MILQKKKYVMVSTHVSFRFFPFLFLTSIFPAANNGKKISNRHKKHPNRQKLPHIGVAIPFAFGGERLNITYIKTDIHIH